MFYKSPGSRYRPLFPSRKKSHLSNKSFVIYEDFWFYMGTTLSLNDAFHNLCNGVKQNVGPTSWDRLGSSCFVEGTSECQPQRACCLLPPTCLPCPALSLKLTASIVTPVPLRYKFQEDCCFLEQSEINSTLTGAFTGRSREINGRTRLQRSGRLHCRRHWQKRPVTSILTRKVWDDHANQSP